MTLMAVAYSGKGEASENLRTARQRNSGACRVSVVCVAGPHEARSQRRRPAEWTRLERFLPLYKVRKRWSDRIKEMNAPLFPGYLFCRFDPHDRLPILKTLRIQIVGFKDGPTAVDESEIRVIKNTGRQSIRTSPGRFCPSADRVRIESGPLVGLEGILTEVKRSHRLVLSVTLPQRSVAVEIDSRFGDCYPSVPTAGDSKTEIARARPTRPRLIEVGTAVQGGPSKEELPKRISRERRTKLEICGGSGCSETHGFVCQRIHCSGQFPLRRTLSQDVEQGAQTFGNARGASPS